MGLQQSTNLIESIQGIDAIFNETINPTLASSIAIATFAGIYATNHFVATSLIKNDSSIINISSLTKNKNQYKDGTYTGTGTGFRGGLTEISVTIKDNKITNIKTISNEDTPKFYDRVESILFDEIISSQSALVDTVSGATYSCNGIIDAVQSALTKASK